MASSSAPVGSFKDITPPKGWTDEKAYMYENYYWAGQPGDIKDMLKTDYGLQNAEPLWTHKPEYGNVLFIVRAEPKRGEKSFYVWNGIERSVCHIVAHGLEEIKATIDKLGDRGYLADLKLESMEPASLDSD